MEDTTSLAIFAMLIACGSWLFITYEPIKQWACDVEQKENPLQWVSLEKHLMLVYHGK